LDTIVVAKNRRFGSGRAGFQVRRWVYARLGAIARVFGPELRSWEIGIDCPEARSGLSGIYNLVQPKPANELGDRKAGLIAALGRRRGDHWKSRLHFAVAIVAGARSGENSCFAHNSAFRRIDSRPVAERSSEI